MRPMSTGCLSGSRKLRRKSGVGVKEFSTRKAMFDTRCFEIRRIDGSTTDFSVKPCLDGKAPSAFAETLRAMRTEVVGDIKQMKWEFFRASNHPDGRSPLCLDRPAVCLWKKR